MTTYSSRCIFVNASGPLRRQQQVDAAEMTDAGEWLAEVIDVDSGEVCIISHGAAAAGLCATQVCHRQAGAASVQPTTAWTHQQTRLATQSKPGTERVQALADISHLALYAFAVYKAITLHTCMLSQQQNSCTNCKSAY